MKPLPLAAAGVLLLMLVLPSTALADNLQQDFETWARTTAWTLSSNENWVANDAIIGEPIPGDLSFAPRSGTNSAWFPPFFPPYLPTNAWINTPRLVSGMGRFSFHAKTRPGGGASGNSFEVQVSTDEQNSWSVLTNISLGVGTWDDGYYEINTNIYSPCFIRIRKIGPQADIKNFLGIDDIAVTNPPAGITISGTTNTPSDVLQGQEADITTTITTVGLVSNLVPTLYWRAGPLDDYAAILMETNGSPTAYKTTSPIPGQDVIPGTPVDYYIKVVFEGPEAAPVYDPTTYATDPYYYVIRKAPLESDFETMTVQILTETDEAMYGILDEVWRKVVTPAASFDTPQFLFEGVSTNGTDTNTWGDAYQAISNLAVYGKAQETNSAIVIEGVHTGHLAFTFYESNLFYSAENCDYVNFDGTWPSGWDDWGSHTNSEGWQIIDGRLTNNGGETNKAFETVGNSCVLRDTAGDQYVLSPYLDNGVGEVSLQYRNGWWSGDYEARAGFYIEKSVDGNEWIRIATQSDIRSKDYLYYSLNVGDRNYHYIRIRNSTNDPHGRLLLDEITITEPVTGVSFTNLTHSPADPDIASNVNISVEITPYDRTSNLVAQVWFRAGTNGSFYSIAMTNTHDDYFVTETPVPKGIKGIIQYYVECLYEGFGAAPAYDPHPAWHQPAAYTNRDSFYRVQRFEDWDPATAWGTYNHDGWILNDGRIESQYGYHESTNNPSWTNTAWLANFDTLQYTNAYVQTPELSLGAGALTFYCTNLGASSIEFEVQYTTEAGGGGGWQTWAVLTNQLSGGWTEHYVPIHTNGSLYVRILKTQATGTDEWLGIDDITITYVPSMVNIHDVTLHPGYPTEDDNVYISAFVDAAPTVAQAINIEAVLHYRIGDSGDYTPVSMSASGNYYLSATPILKELLSTGDEIQYYIESTFSGYFHLDKESHSPTFSPPGIPQASEARYFDPPLDSPHVYEIREFASTYDSLAVTSNVAGVTLNLVGDHAWEGLLDLSGITTNRLAWSFSGFDRYTNGAMAYVSESTVGDDYQSRFNMPQASTGQVGGAELVVYGDFSDAKYIFRYNSEDNRYFLARCVYQDFNTWDTTDYFDESFFGIEIATVSNPFDAWPTNETKALVAGAALGDFEQWSATNKPVGYTQGPVSGSDGWTLREYVVVDELSGNNACRFNPTVDRGDARPIYDTMQSLGGLGHFTFRHRVRLEDEAITWYGGGDSSNWLDYAVDAEITVPAQSPGWPYLSVFSRFRSETNYYEYRLEQTRVSDVSFTPQLQVSLWRHDADESSHRLDISSKFSGSLTGNTHSVRFIAVTNNNGYVYLEGLHNGVRRCYGNLYYDSGAERIMQGGTIGFFTSEADVEVRNVELRHMDIQRFEQWNQSPSGVYSNNNWLINNGYPNNDYCRLDARDEVGTPLQDFDSWSASSWGSHTNNGWVLNDGKNVGDYLPHSPTNAAWLRNTGTPYLRTPYMSSGIEKLTFYAKSRATDDLEFQVRVSDDDVDWSTVFATVTNTGVKYTRKMKLTFTGYSPTNAALTNFPVLVTLHEGLTGFNYADFASSEGHDLRFANSNELLELNYEIQEWNTNGNSYVWLQVPELVDSNSYAWAYWGSAAMSEPPPYSLDGSVWEEDYKAVYHMEESDARDSTANRNHGTASGDTLTDTGGKVGSAQEFDGDYDNIDCGNPPGLLLSGDITLSAWVKPDTISGEDSIASKWGNSWIFGLTDGKVNFYVNGWKYANTPVSAGVWSHVAAVFKDSANRVYFYRNGSADGDQDVTGTPGTGASLTLGSRGTGSWFDGSIDEIRITDSARSPDWMWAAYQTVASASFITYDSVVTETDAIRSWTPHTFEINRFTPTYVRIFKSQDTGADEYLGLDDVEVFSPAPGITTPYLDYSPGRLDFQYNIVTSTKSEGRIRGSVDGVTWEDIDPGFTQYSGWYSYSLTTNNWPGLTDYHYLRIESISTSAQFLVQDIYITEASPHFTDLLPLGDPDGATDWEAPYGAWAWDDSIIDSYRRDGYIGPMCHFRVQTAPSNSNPGELALDETWTTLEEFSTSNFLYEYESVTIEDWDNKYIRIRHTTGETSLVVDELGWDSWRDTIQFTSNSWAAGEVWVAPDPAETDLDYRSLEFWRSRANPDLDQYVRTSFLTGGVDLVQFRYQAHNPPVEFKVYRSSFVDSNLFVDVIFETNLTSAVTEWTALAIEDLQLTNAVHIQVRHTSTNRTAKLYIDDLSVKNYPARDEDTWVAFNALINIADGREFPKEPTVNTAYLNNHPARETGGRTFAEDQPHLQSPSLPNGAGEASMWLKRWDFDAAPAILSFRTSPNETNAPDTWLDHGSVAVGTTNFIYFTTNIFAPDDHYLRIYCSTSAPDDRICIDNLIITEPIRSDFTITNITFIPDVPLDNGPANVRAELRQFILYPSNFQVRAYYNVGSNDWASWETNEYVTLEFESEDHYGMVYSSTQGIPQQNVDTVVQYYVAAIWDGTLAPDTWEEAKEGKDFVNPPYYEPIDLNEQFGATNPYYFVFSCSTGTVWINEVNVKDYLVVYTQFVEVIGWEGADISRWAVEMVDNADVLTDHYDVPEPTEFAGETNGFGFWVLGTNTIPGVDLALTNALLQPLGLRLIRSMGAYEDKICMGNEIACATLVANGYEWIGDDFGGILGQTRSYGREGEGKLKHEFAWEAGELYGLTPGWANLGQDLIAYQNTQTLSVACSWDPSVGTPSPDYGVHEYSRGDYITCRMTDSPIVVSAMATQYTCVGWTRTGDVPAFSGNPTNTGSFRIESDSSITWQWKTNVYVSATNDGNGSVDRKGWYVYGTNVTITATPDAYNEFTHWTGDTNDAAVSSNTIAFTLNRARGVTNTLVAHFESTDKTLDVASPYGMASPAAGLYTNHYNDEIACMVTNPVIVNGTTQYICTGWTASGSVPAMPPQGFATNVTWGHWNAFADYSRWLATYNGENGSGWQVALFADGSERGLGNWTIDGIASNGISVGDDRIVTNTFITDSDTSKMRWSPSQEVANVSIEHRLFTVAFNNATLTGATHYAIVTNADVFFMPGDAPNLYNAGSCEAVDWFPLAAPASNVTAISTGPFNITNDSTVSWTWNTNYYLATSTAGSGTVDRVSGWIARGSNLVIQASPASGLFEFENWSGDTNGCVIEGDTLTIPTMDVPRNITAHFTGEPEQFTDRGTPYWWLELFFTNNYEYWDTNDYDLDGLLTWMEYVAGTIPTNFWSVFRLLECVPYDGSNYISWYATTNSGLTNPASIFRATNLVSDPAWSMIATDAVPRSATGTNVWWDMAPPEGVVHYRPSITWTNGL